MCLGTIAGPSSLTIANSGCRSSKQLLQKYYKHLCREAQRRQAIQTSSYPEYGAAAQLQIRDTSEECDLRPWKDIPGLKSYSSTETTLGLMRKKDFSFSRMHVFWRDAVKEFGPIMKLSFPGQPPAVAVAHPDDIKTLYHETSDNPTRTPLHSLFKTPKMDFGDSEEQENLWKKKGVQSLMLNKESISEFLTKTDDVVLDFMERIADLQRDHGEMPENFSQELYKFSLEALAMVAFGERFGSLDPNLPVDSDIMNLINQLEATVKGLPNNNNILHIWKLIPNGSATHLKEAQETLLRIIGQRMDSIKDHNLKQGNLVSDSDPSLVEALLCIPGVTQGNVTTMVHDMFLAGVDSISNTLGFMLYLIAKHPRAQSLLREEIHSIVGKGSFPITEEQIDQMHYLKACIREGFRVFPPTFGSLRILENDVILSNYHVPKGKQVLSLNMIACWDESIFPRADEFIPERWLSHQPLGPIHPFASLPFSHGPKLCMGKYIAEREIHNFIARVVQRYEIAYKYEDIDLLTNSLSTPSEPLKFEFLEVN